MPVLLFIAALLLVTVSCTRTEAEPPPNPQENITDPEPVPQEPAVEVPAGEPAAMPRITDVEAAYQKALEAFYWFQVDTMPLESFIVDDKPTYIEMDGHYYYKVKHDTIKTYADLENYLQSLLAGEIAAGLLDSGIQRYRDIDGSLYAIDAGRGTDLFKGEEMLIVTQESDDTFLCTVQVELLSEDDMRSVIGYETHEFFYELADGRWVFTNFYLFR